MKKKLLTVLFVALLACLFAFTVSAANEVTLTDGTTVDFETVFNVTKSGNVENVVTGFKSGYDKNMVTDVIFPDYVAGIECNGLFGKYATAASTTIRTLTFAATDTFFISGDNIFSGLPLTRVTFDPNCVVEIRKGNFADCTSLTSITFPKFKKLAGSSFKGCSSMVSTNDLVLADGMTEIGGHAFNGCTSLTGTVYFPSTLTTIQEYSFQNTGFTYFDLSKCENLTAVGGSYGGPFNNNDGITRLDLSGCTNLKALKNSFAQGCDNLTEVILPPNLETIPHKAFAQCYKLQSIVLPASVTYVADEAFHSARNGQTIKTFTVYLQSYVEFHATYPFRDSSAKIEYVLIGEGMTAEAFVAANTFSGITGATVVDYYNPDTKETYTVGQTISNHTIIEGYCKSLALTGAHKSGDNPCVINCETCAVVEAKENPVHTLSVFITYDNGFEATGVKITKCINKGCTEKTTEEADKMFVCNGYSAPEYGECSIAIGYTVNNDAYLEYQEALGKEVGYGIFVAVKDILGENDIADENGNISNGVVMADIANSQFVTFEIKVVGLDSYKTKEIAIGGFVSEKDDQSVKYTYLQDGEPKEGDKYYFATYNEIYAIVNKEN